MKGENQKKVKIPTNFGSLEGEIYLNKNNPIGILIFHPHPLYGGTMSNNVVSAIFHNFVSKNISTLRFNFRGVGNSDGSSTNGTGEREDSISALEFFNKEAPWIEKILLIGYSFGAAIGCSIVDENPKIIGYIAISYPFTFIPMFIEEAKSIKPKFFVMGKNDDFTKVDSFLLNLNQMPKPKEQLLLEGINHFWNGSEGILVREINNWYEKLF